MTRTRKRILFLAEGITMAHFTRPAVLAEALDPAEWDVYFWTPKRYHSLLRPTVTHLGDLRTLDPAAFLDSLAQGTVSYSAKTIHQYVQDELAIFKEIEPDLVIGDYRLSLCISAPFSGLPFASIFNAYWSPYRKQPAIVPELPGTKWLSPRVMNSLYAVIEPIVDAYHTKPLNDVRRAYGLSRLSFDMRDFFTAGDLVLYPDVPELVPLVEAPAHHKFIGPCRWSAECPKPVWWADAMTSAQPKVFVALGSSGPIKALPAVLEALSQLSVTVILATSGRLVGMVGANVYAADLLPFEETARHCLAVVSHGGSSGVYPALSAGAPILAIPGNMDTHQSAAVLEKSGAGLSVRVERASTHRLRIGLERLISDPRFKKAAQKWEATLANYDTAEIFPEVLRTWFGQTTDSGHLRRH